MLVVCLTHIEDIVMLTIDEHMYWLPCLIVHIQSASSSNLLDRSILDAAIVVIAAIADLQCLCLHIRLLVEELSSEEVVEVVGL